MKNLLYITILLTTILTSSCTDRNRNYERVTETKTTKVNYSVQKIHNNYHVIEIDGKKFLGNTNGGIIEIK